MKVRVRVRTKCRQRKRIQKDIQEAVCNGILQADTKREQMAKEKIKKTKLSGWEIARLIICVVVAAIYTVLAIMACIVYSKDVGKVMAVAGQMIAVAAAYVMLAFADYATAKNKDKTFGFNVITLVVAIMSLLVAFFK